MHAHVLPSNQSGPAREPRLQSHSNPLTVTQTQLSPRMQSCFFSSFCRLKVWLTQIPKASSLWVFAVYNQSIQTRRCPHTLVTVTCENASNCCEHTHRICSSRSVYLHWPGVPLRGKGWFHFILAVSQGPPGQYFSLHEAKETQREREAFKYIYVATCLSIQAEMSGMARGLSQHYICARMWGLPGYVWL